MPPSPSASNADHLSFFIPLRPSRRSCRSYVRVTAPDLRPLLPDRFTQVEPRAQPSPTVEGYFGGGPRHGRWCHGQSRESAAAKMHSLAIGLERPSAPAYGQTR